MIDKQDYHILMEGAGNPLDTSVRDVSAGLAASGLTTALSLLPSVDYDKLTGPVVLFTILFCSFIFFSVLSVLAHMRTKGDKGRKSYVELMDRIKIQVGDTTSVPTPATFLRGRVGYVVLLILTVGVTAYITRTLTKRAAPVTPSAVTAPSGSAAPSPKHDQP